MHPVIPYVIAALLFGLGIYGVLVRRNAVLLLMAVELMLNAVNLVLVTADATVRAVLPQTGQVFALFIIVLAAAEVGIGLAVILQLYRLRQSIAVDEVPLADGPPPNDPGEPPRPDTVPPGAVPRPGTSSPDTLPPQEQPVPATGSIEVLP